MAKARALATSTEDRKEICDQLQRQQRLNTMYQKSRIMNNNRLVQCVATDLGYKGPASSPLERERKFKEATALIEQAKAGRSVKSQMVPFITENLRAISSFRGLELASDRELTRLAKMLHVRDWMEETAQRGFGHKSLGKIIGECGDLANYDSPGRIWRRMGCAPYTCERLGLTLMGSTWASKRYGELTKAEWVEFGYNRRRRSIMHIVAECLLKNNQTGPYRSRYDFKKAEAIEKHPDWAPPCKACEGSGRKNKPCPECDEGIYTPINGDKVRCPICAGTGLVVCDTCRGSGKIMMRVHRHGLLLAAKLVLKNLWIAWNPDLVWPNIGDAQSRIAEANWRRSQEETEEVETEAAKIA